MDQVKSFNGCHPQTFDIEDSNISILLFSSNVTLHLQPFATRGQITEKRKVQYFLACIGLEKEMEVNAK